MTAILLALALVVAPPAPAQRPKAIRIPAPFVVVVPPATEAHYLPPGVFFEQSAFDAVEGEMTRLQNQEVRLSAENASLRKSAEIAPGRVLTYGALVFAIGVVVGGAVALSF